MITNIRDGAGSGYDVLVSNSGALYVQVVGGSLAYNQTSASAAAPNIFGEGYAAPSSGALVYATYLNSGLPLRLTNGSDLSVAGSVWQGTNPWIVLGSLAVTNAVSTLGSVAISSSSVLTQTGSVAITSSTALTQTGSVALTSYAALLGSFAVTSQAVWAGAGSVVLSGTFASWTGVGSIWNAGGYTAGSVAITSSVALTQTGSVAITSSTALTQTGSVAITSSVLLTQTGSVAVTSSYDSIIMEEGRRAPNFAFSGALYTASGLTANMIIPAAGSKILLKSFSISTDVANRVDIKFSGSAANTLAISRFYIPASGTVIQNMIGCEPSGATDCPLAVGVTTAGNIYVSAFVRYVP